LFPNQFVNIKLLVNTLRDADLVPSSAIARGAPGTFVYVVKPDNTVAVQKVKLGPTDGQRIAILSVLQPGEGVVFDGADRLRDGAKVTVTAAKHPNAGRGQSAPSQASMDAVAPGDRQPAQRRD
jgi:membrane fusion protein, multidrug efflux system